jgi:FixJ family two-component response regulator
MKMYSRPVHVSQKTNFAPIRRFQKEDDFSVRGERADISVSQATNESHPMSATILIVDDEPNVRLTFRSALVAEHYEVYEADSGPKALDQLAQRQHDAALLDLRMPGMEGLELLEQIRGKGINTPVVIVTAYADVPNAVAAMKLGAIDFLQKPVLPEDLRNVVREVLMRHEPEQAATEPHDLDDCLRRAKRAINLRDFDTARSELIMALDIDPESRQAMSLVGVMLEMREECDQAKHATGTAVKTEKARGSASRALRRFFNLFHCGPGKKSSVTEIP